MNGAVFSFFAMKRHAITLFLLLLGGLLVCYALLGPALQLFGASTIGSVTEIRRQGGDRGETIRNRYNFGVGFHFFLPDGKRVEGATTVVGSSFSAGIAKGPARVLYFPFLPYINSLEQQTHLSLHSIILLGVGCLLIYLGITNPLNTKKRRKK